MWIYLIIQYATTEYETDTEYLDEEEESDVGSIYDPDTFISGPKISENGTLGLDLLEFEYPFQTAIINKFTQIVSFLNFNSVFRMDTIAASISIWRH